MIPNPDDHIKAVEIIEPPIQELKKRGPWFTTACMSGCGCVLLFILGIAVGIKIFIGAGPTQMKNLPDNFPSDVPVYDQYNIDKITQISGRYKSRSMEVSALLPKIVLSPLITGADIETNSSQNKSNIFFEFWRIITAPVGDTRDTVQIEWRDITSDPETMMQYYKSKLAKSDCQIDAETESNKFVQFSFSRADGLSGTVYIEPDEKKKKIIYAYLIVNLPPTNKPVASVSSTAEKETKAEAGNQQ